MMRLVIVDSEGVVHEVTDIIDEYDLTRPLAQADVCAEIKRVLDRVVGQESSEANAREDPSDD